MKAVRILWLALVLAGVGCGTSETKPDPNAANKGPLTVEKWKELPVAVKYDAGSFERLKQGNKELKTRTGWDKFMKDTVIPERKKDIPGTPGR